MKALKEVHKHGIVHRDISPDNIFICNDGNIKLIDFGTARFSSKEEEVLRSVEVKWEFAPPEQYRSKGQGTYTDVYGLCATMYYCMTGKLPPQAMERLMGAPFPTPTELGINISPVWESAVIDGLELYVQKRIQNMEELWQRLYGDSISEPFYSEVLLSQAKQPSQSEVSEQQRYEKTQPTESFIEDISQNDSADNYVKARQSGFDRIRDICVQIYRKIKEK